MNFNQVSGNIAQRTVVYHDFMTKSQTVCERNLHLNKTVMS